MTTPVVSLPEFLLSVREAGYRSPAHAVAELVDNAIQAGAARVEVRVLEGELGLEIHVQDDGRGVPPSALAQALSFGGSTRFGDRAGLGRFGMGLPSASLSVARRVEVYSWADGDAAMVGLDLDRLPADGALPSVASAPLPSTATPTERGTLVRWTRCDRLSGYRRRGLELDLHQALGRVFRRFLWDGLVLMVNGAACPAADPLLLDPRAPFSGAASFGAPLVIPVRTALGAGNVGVWFSELPVMEWSSLSNAEKRRRGITKGAGVSVLRAGREIDAGWLFMGDKRRENYDDWWRCEVRFMPELDEAFGVTYTKQGVRPTPELVEALTPELSAVARALNARVRRAHETLEIRARYAASEEKATDVEQRMRPLPTPQVDGSPLVARLAELWPDLLVKPARSDVRIVEHDLGAAPVFEVITLPRRLVVVLNRAHPFYAQCYAPLIAAGEIGAGPRAHVELLLVALARAEAARAEGLDALQAYRAEWGLALAELVKS